MSLNQHPLVVRSLSGIVYVALVILAVYLPNWLDGSMIANLLSDAFFLFVAVVATYEVYNNLAKVSISANNPLGYAAVVLFVICISLKFNGIVGITLWSIMLVLFMFPSVIMVAQLWRKDKSPFTTIVYTLLPFVWIAIPVASMMIVKTDYPGLLMLNFLLVWTNDTFAFLTGKLLGKHKLWQRHSPGKTWEGFIGGIIFSGIVAVIVGPLLLYGDFESSNLVQGLSLGLLGLMVGIAATLGDFVESMFKRSVNVKDSGSIMPGHGGMLDRFDSMLITAPLFLLFLNFLILKS